MEVEVASVSECTKIVITFTFYFFLYISEVFTYWVSGLKAICYQVS